MVNVISLPWPKVIYEGHPISSDNDPIEQNLLLKDVFQ